MKKQKEKLELVDLLKRDLPRFFNIDEEDEVLFGVFLNNHSDASLTHDDIARNHLIITLSKNRRLWKWIDKVYEQKRYDYYKSYKETFFNDTPLKEVYSTKTKEYINKLAGIDKWCRDNNTEEPLLKIIQKEHNKLYSRFKVGIKEFNLDQFLSKRLQEVEKRSKSASNIFLDKCNQVEESVIISLYLATVYGVEVKGFLWEKIMDTYLRDLFVSLKTQMGAENILEGTDRKDITKAIENILDIEYSAIKFCADLNEFYDLILFEESEKAKKTASIMSATPLSIPSMDDISKRLNEVLSGGDPSMLGKEAIASTILDEGARMFAEKIGCSEVSNMVNTLFSCSKTIGIDKDVLVDIPIDTNIIESALLIVTDCEIEYYANNKKKVDNNLKLKFLSTITIMSLLEKYKHVVPHDFSQEDEAYILEIENLNEQLNEKDNEIKVLKEKLANLEKSKEEQVQGLLDDLDLSNNNVNRLKKELEDSKENEQEFLAMKEYIYRNAMTDDEIAITMEMDELSIEEKIKYINERKVAIFGGHPNWVNKLKKLIPDAMYLDTNAMSSRRFNRLDKYDLLVICNLFISHGLAWKVSEAIKNVKSKKVVIIDDINTDLIINKIYDAIKLHENN